MIKVRHFTYKSFTNSGFPVIFGVSVSIRYYTRMVGFVNFSQICMNESYCNDLTPFSFRGTSKVVSKTEIGVLVLHFNAAKVYLSSVK